MTTEKLDCFAAKSAARNDEGIVQQRRDKLKSDLTNYIKRIERHHVKEHNYSHDFGKFFHDSRSKNREANFKLAQGMLKEIDISREYMSIKAFISDKSIKN